jgi:ADP-ribosylglycohydrolase
MGDGAVQTGGSIQDRAAGLLLGLAAGDRIGGPVRMALRVAESLAERGAFLADDIARRYLEWWREGAFDTGPMAKRTFEMAAAGMEMTRAALRVHEETGGMTAGCNPAHRSTPLAMCAAIPTDDLPAACAGEAALTHVHPLAGDVAAAAAMLCRSLILGATWPDALARAARQRLPETQQALDPALEAAPSRGGFAPEVLQAAVHHVGQAGSLPEALRSSIDFAGPPNFSPVLVGSIGGARWGASQVDGSLLRHHADLEGRLRAVAEDLARGWWRGGEGRLLPDDEGPV